MRFVPNIRYGTERYPEKVARRLRATNIAAWIGAGTTAFFAVWRFFQGVPHWKYAALVALAYGLAPFLHRFSPVAAPLALAAIAYAWIFWLATNVGISNGITFFYFTTGALGILLLGAERVFLSIVVGAVATGLLIILHIGVWPGDLNFSGFPSSPLTFVFNVLCYSAILYGIVFYAVRQYTRAEERAERERQRSESLLVNILPPSIAERLKGRPDVAIADAYPEASILFADMAGFTARASDTTPADLVQFLNSVYTRLDRLVEHRALEKNQDHRRCLHGGKRRTRGSARSCRQARGSRPRHPRRIGRVGRSQGPGSAGAHRHRVGAGRGRRCRHAQVLLRRVGRCGEYGLAHGIDR